MADSTLPGDRLRELRRARGLTQEGLAERAGLSLAVVKKVERGGDARLSTYHALARALRVTTSTLFDSAGPHQRRRGDDDNIDLMPLRQALAPPATFTGRMAESSADVEPDLENLRAAESSLAAAYHRDDYDEVAGQLPPMIRAAHAAVRYFDNGPEHTAALRVRANVLQMAGRYLTQVRAYDLAHLALRDAVDDARAAGARSIVAGAVYQQGWLLMRQGRLDEAEQVSVSTAEEIEPRISRATPASLGAWGKLLVHSSAAASRNNRPREARDMLRMARTAGAALGGATAVEMSSWGRFDWRTVAYQGIENQLVAEHPRRVLSLSERMPTPRDRAFERRHLLDVAQAHAMLRQPGEATAILGTLLVNTPEWLRHQRMAAETFGDVLRVGGRRLTRQQRDLAAFFGVAEG